MTPLDPVYYCLGSWIAVSASVTGFFFFKSELCPWRSLRLYSSLFCYRTHFWGRKKFKDSAASGILDILERMNVTESLQSLDCNIERESGFQSLYYY